MLFSAFLQPPLHGAGGILDELLLCLPLVVILMILVIGNRRARPAQTRERVRRVQTSAEEIKPDVEK